MATRNSEGVHVLAVPFAGLVGHMNPLMSLCEQLAAEGVAVTFAYSQSYYERSPAYMAKIKPNESSIAEYSCRNGIRVIGVRDGLRYQEHLSSDSPRLQAQATIDMEDNLVELARSTQHPFPVTCIIADVFVYCASSAARRLGIPHVAFWTQSAASFAAHVVATQNYSTLKLEHDAPTAAADAGDGASSLITCIPGCPAFKFNELPTFLQPCDPTNFLFSILMKCFKDMEDCPRVLLNTYHEVEYESMEFINKRKNIFAVGPLLPSNYLRVQQQLDSRGSLIRRASPNVGITGMVSFKEDHGCSIWLDMQKPKSVLFVSFGSLALMCEDQIVELAAGLEASGCPFLMVVREAMMEGQAARFPVGFRERLTRSGRALFVAWAPQLEVLDHSSVGGFLTHCGWNSILEGICKGIPFLGWPYFADQMLNCRCITDTWKIGIDFEDKSKSSTVLSTNGSLISRQLIEEKVRFLMDPSSSATIRQRANELAMLASKAILQDDGSSRLNLKSFTSWLHKMA